MWQDRAGDFNGLTLSSKDVEKLMDKEIESEILLRSGLRLGSNKKGFIKRLSLDGPCSFDGRNLNPEPA